MTDIEARAIDNYLGYLIRHSDKCSNCALKHHDDICFFAVSCFPNYVNFVEKDYSDMKEKIEKAFGEKGGEEK